MIVGHPLQPFDREMLFRSLGAGTVPPCGRDLIRVGRSHEMEAIEGDLDLLAKGGSTFRMILGPEGMGKTFLTHLAADAAISRRFVTLRADLCGRRRLHGSAGEARALLFALVASASHRARPGGGALPGILDRFFSRSEQEAGEKGVRVDRILEERLAPLEQFSFGPECVSAIKSYCRGERLNQPMLKAAAMRWLGAGFSSSAEARAALGVPSIVHDHNLPDMLRILAAFVQIAGYSGLLVMIDKLEAIGQLQHAGTREQNWRQVLGFLEDSLSGRSPGLGFLLAGTPDATGARSRDHRSLSALNLRLRELDPDQQLANPAAPIIHLRQLSSEEADQLLHKLHAVFVADGSNTIPPASELIPAFMDRFVGRIGESYFRTPADLTRDFVQLLARMHHNPSAGVDELLGVPPHARCTRGQVANEQ